MFEEDFPPPGYRKPTEGFLFWYLALSLIFTSWNFGGGVFWAPASLVALGFLAPILIQIHKNLDLFEFRGGMVRFLIALSPFWLTLVIQIIGLRESPLATISIGERNYLTLGTAHPWSPINTLPSASWMPTLLSGSLYAMGLCIPFIAASHHLFRKLLVTLSANALVLCILGFIIMVAGFDKVLGFYTPPSEQFFGAFPHSEHWASFGLLWLIVLTGLVDHFARRQRTGRFLERGGILMLAATAILAYSILITGTPLHILLLALFYTFVFIEIGSLRKKTDRWLNGLSRLAPGAWTGAGLMIFTAGCFYATSSYWMPHINDTGNQTAHSFAANIPAHTHLAIWRDSLSLVEKQPWFGWGVGSYPTVIAFHQQADLGSALHPTPMSDLLHSLVERGILGTLAWIMPVLVVAGRFRSVKYKRVFSYYLWSAVLCAITLGAVSFPFKSPAFTLSFWIILFSAYQWSQIATTQSPKATLPNIVFSPSEIEASLSTKM